MSNKFTAYLSKSILNKLFGSVEFEVPNTLYLGLSTSSISDIGNITEPNTTYGYNRLAIANNPTNFPITINATKTNGVIFTFPMATSDWGVISDWFVSDAIVDGNILAYGKLKNKNNITEDITQTVIEGDILSFGSGSIIITLD